VPFFKRNSALLRGSIEKVVKPNVVFLRQCGLGDCDISKFCLSAPWMLNTNLDRVQAMVVCAEGLGVPRGSRMFRYMLNAISFVREENVAAKVEYLKKTLRWSDAEVRIAVSKAPTLLARSKDMLQCRSAFFFSEVGLEPTYIAHQPSLLSYSLEGRLKPRYYVVRFLKENGFVKHDPSYCTVVKLTEKEFVKKFICPHKETAPHLSEDYAAACRGEVPANFKFV
jgi:mTERF domain-containing protein